MGKAELTRERILEAAEAEFAAHGFAGARVDAIARRAEVNPRMLHVHFDSKEGMYVAVLSRVYGRLAKREEQMREEGPCAALIEAYIDMSFDFLTGDEAFVRMVMWENLNRAQYIDRSEAVAAKTNSFEKIRAVLARGMAEGVFRPDLDVNDVILSMNMMCFSYFSNAGTFAHIIKIDYASQAEVDKRRRTVTRMILGDILAKEKEK